MKKLLLLVLFLFPTLASAQTVSFQNNLSYGSTGSDVSALQEFLVTQHLLAPQYVTGSFYSLTLAAVKSFQTAESISPVSGFVGPITRNTINTILAQETPQSEESAATTTEPVDLSQSTTTPVYTPPQVIYVPIPPQAPAVVSTPPVTQNQTFGTIIPAVPINPPTCSLTGTTTAYSAIQLSGTIDWITQNASQITLSDSSNGVTWKLTPVAFGEIRDVIVYKNGTIYTATIDQGITCSISLP